MNPIKLAVETMNSIIDSSLTSRRTIQDIESELAKLDKKTLVKMLAATMKAEKVTVESVARKILEHADCEWLTHDDIATAIAGRMGTKTTHKGIADYASKRDGWNVLPRKSAAERRTAVMALVNNQ